jgi:hypothetical protein
LFLVLAKKKSLSVWILFSCIITLIFIGFNPTVHTFPDYVTIIFLGPWAIYAPILSEAGGHFRCSFVSAASSSLSARRS